MTILVTDQGFRNISEQEESAELASIAANIQAVDLPSDANPADLADHLDHLTLIRVDFPSFADGRGFTIARQLRLMGYKGELRAKGHVISDQYAMARRAGFDGVEISDDLAARQPEGEWVFRADWRAHDYQSRLRAG
jgi:uncharacterized protein (DUF934 family)